MDAERRAGAGPRALRFDPASMERDERARDRQTKSEAARGLRAAPFELDEHVEDTSAVRRRKTHPVVSDSDENVASFFADCDLDVSARRCEFRGIVEQIRQHL